MKAKPQVLVLEDDKVRMAKVYANNQLVFEGNYWDFHCYCHGTEFKFNNKKIDLKNTLWGQGKHIGQRMFGYFLAGAIGGELTTRKASFPEYHEA
jgi:hypothetical protein